MKKTILLILFIATTCMANAVQYTKSDSVKVVSLLSEAQKRKLHTQQELVMFFTRQLYDIPYVASTLDVNRKEQLIVNLRQLDCTTYVENVVALTLCSIKGKRTFDDFCKNLAFIRYRKGGGVCYPARLHYFTDWINDNVAAGICRNINSPRPPFSATQTIFVNYMTAHSDKYSMLKGNISDQKEIKKVEKNLCGKKYAYIPKGRIDNSKLLRNTIHNGDIIVILTSKYGLDTQHLGFALWRKDGLHLVNASSIHKKVVEEPMLLRTYLQKHKLMTGIRIVRIADK